MLVLSDNLFSFFKNYPGGHDSQDITKQEKMDKWDKKTCCCWFKIKLSFYQEL